jgi:hypothetical protein
MKKPLMTWTGNPKREEEWILIMQENVHEKGGAREDFVKADRLDENSTAQEWLFAPSCLIFHYVTQGGAKQKQASIYHCGLCSLTNLKATLCNAGQHSIMPGLQSQWKRLECTSVSTF